MSRHSSSSITKVLENIGAHGFYESAALPTELRRLFNDLQTFYIPSNIPFDERYRHVKRRDALRAASLRREYHGGTDVFDGFHLVLQEILELLTCGFNSCVKAQLAAIVQRLQSSQ
jgi:hypothetical protein